jgi:hypothetical protein
MITKEEIRDGLLSADWALVSFFLVKMTPLEIISSNFLQNIGGVGLFLLFIIIFESLGKNILWKLMGKRHRIGKQIFGMIIFGVIIAGLFAITQ